MVGMDLLPRSVPNRKSGLESSSHHASILVNNFDDVLVHCDHEYAIALSTHLTIISKRRSRLSQFDWRSALPPSVKSLLYESLLEASRMVSMYSTWWQNVRGRTTRSWARLHFRRSKSRSIRMLKWSVRDLKTNSGTAWALFGELWKLVHHRTMVGMDRVFQWMSKQEVQVKTISSANLKIG